MDRRLGHQPHTTRRTLITVLAVTIGIGCHSDSITAVKLNADQRNQRISARVGQRIDITLQSVGPGEYAIPPILSATSVAFLDASHGGAVPAGVTQYFHFRGASPGQTIVTFVHSGNNPTVQDTIDVR